MNQSEGCHGNYHMWSFDKGSWVEAAPCACGAMLIKKGYVVPAQVTVDTSQSDALLDSHERRLARLEGLIDLIRRTG